MAASGSGVTIYGAMMLQDKWKDIRVEVSGHVAVVEIRRPPHNYFDLPLIVEIAEAFEQIDTKSDLRAIVLASSGKAFCAGASFSGDEGKEGYAVDPGALYREALRLFDTKKPVIAAIQGAAVGGGLGLALVADLRVAAPEARFCANFVKLGIHPGFGLTHTLPRLIGPQAASLLFYTGRRIDGVTALGLGLVDELVSADQLRSRAMTLANEIAENAPLAVQATRQTMRAGLTDAVRAQLGHEEQEQLRLFKTDDYHEGVRAVRERRPGRWVGA
jgi:enoyl-CoA hydratase/carnithine racemase